MENPIKTIQEKVNGMKGRLRDRLDSLPPRVRLKVVLVMFGLFALCSLYMIGSAIINFGNGKTSNIGTCQLPVAIHGRRDTGAPRLAYS